MEFFELFTSIVYEYFDVCCPVERKSISIRSMQKPWINRDIKSYVKKRQSLYLLYQRGRVSRAVYSRYSNFTSSIRRAKRNFYHEKFANYKNDVKRTWESLNSVLGRWRKCKDEIDRIKDGDSLHVTKESIAKSFNTYFSSVGCVIGSSISGHLRGSFPNSFDFTPVTSSDVDSTIQSLKNKRNISVLKRVSSVLSPVLAKIINWSVFSGVFPASLKIARVIPICKKGSREDRENYRPISNLPVYSKIFEKVICRQVYKYLDKFSIVSNRQFGFRSGKSTTEAILDFLSFVYPTLDTGFNVVSILCDFSKAFDSVDHDILLIKLYHYGILGIWSCLKYKTGYL